MSEMVDDRKLIAELRNARQNVYREERRESRLWVSHWPRLSDETRLVRWRAVAAAILAENKPITWAGRPASSGTVPPQYDGRSFARGVWL